MEARNRGQGINSASLCSLACRYDNPIPTRFQPPMDCLKIPVLLVMVHVVKLIVNLVGLVVHLVGLVVHILGRVVHLIDMVH
jgi:hypothetical protein